MLALLGTAAYRLHEITAAGWMPIGEAKGGKIAFVDGGNSPIIKTPAAELQRIRTAAVATSGKKLTEVAQKEGYILARLQPDSSGKLHFNAKLTDSTLEIGSSDIEGISSKENELTKFCEAARRIAEIKTAESAVKKLDGGFAVLDGTLEAFSENEKKALEGLFSAAAEKDVIIGAVAKTCSLLTSNGEPLIEAAERTSSGKDGYVLVAEGISERHNAAVAVAKLNKSANYLFRVEAATAEDLKKLLPELKSQSNDLAFPGYPYGLIMADRFARVSDNDADVTKAKIRATADGETRKLLQSEKALDAHSILDSM
ncbi:hypothetical protein HYU40_02715 [Candidatus Woesearchaeota archaeon]|nr:hypothetical protein [Candidatus Woesearchaeota archaeon]